MYGVSSFRLAEAGHEVVGVEFSELAVKEFFTENNLPFEHEQVGKLVRYKVSLMCCILHWSGVLCVIFTTRNFICNLSYTPPYPQCTAVSKKVEFWQGDMFECYR